MIHSFTDSGVDHELLSNYASGLREQGDFECLLLARGGNVDNRCTKLNKPKHLEGKSQYQVNLTKTLYRELRNLAAARMANQFGPQTLQATALVHEAWLRLGGDEQPVWESRAHYYNAVAEAMRHILVDRARRRQAVRHGGAMHRVHLDTWKLERVDSNKAFDNDEIIIIIHDALHELSALDKGSAELIKLHYFVGLSISEIAELMDISTRTAQRHLSFARSWLGLKIKKALST
jgi:RNA polymerase sigma factor (TIGR02999 family)